ncbi:MAG: DUF2269 domain-containing protein [Polyangiaceae bacterium]
MFFLVLKTIHVLGAVLFLGTGLGSAYYKLRARASGQVSVIAWCDREVVRADWCFTVPAGLLMPTTGLWMALLYRMPLTTPFVWQALLGYGIAGVTWLPAAFLQIRMRELSARAAASNEPLPDGWYRAQRTWTLLGIPSFGITMAVVWMMVSKHTL